MLTKLVFRKDFLKAFHFHKFPDDKCKIFIEDMILTMRFYKNHYNKGNIFINSYIVYH